MEKHICPWWMAYTFDNPLRRLIHKPEKIFTPHLGSGMIAADIGCGMGYFTIGMARIVGETGKIIAVDIQRKMLDVTIKRAKKAGLAQRITTFLCDEKDIGITEEVDFALAFWMVHETPDALHFLAQVKKILKKSGRLLIAEPKLHVTGNDFKKTLSLAQKLGYNIIDSPKIYFSHAAMIEKQ